MSSTSPRIPASAAGTNGTNVQRPAAGGFWPVLLCWLAVALDGFDLVVLGAVIPTLTKTQALGFDAGTLTTAAPLGLAASYTVASTTVDLSRIQFGTTSIYHFLFVPLTLGLAPLVAVMQTLWHRKHDDAWLRLTRFFGTLLLINFAIGVATGLVGSGG